MPKRIAFCADGTWDDPNNNSNVCQLYQALESIPDVQVSLYDSGVGADGNPLIHLLGGTMGAGLFQKIKDGYSAIAAIYQPGDQIFLFGFSRGAYTARSIAGMIAHCGLPTVDQADPPCVDMAFEAYRNAAQRPTLLTELDSTYKMDNAQIQMVGVWDTVGSLGIPAIFGDIDVGQYGFLDTTLHPDVLNAVQALSIDEQRLQFQPCIWTSAPAPNQTITQVWFAGVHCDVGGGYPPDPTGAALSNIPLRWMADQAELQGLTFDQDLMPHPILPSSAPDAAATLHNSRTGAYRIFPAHVRNIVSPSCLGSTVNVRSADPNLKYAPPNLHLGPNGLADAYSLVPV
jgi:uncharacterized protein (DUF2235 family)